MGLNFSKIELIHVSFTSELKFCSLLRIFWQNLVLYSAAWLQFDLLFQHYSWFFYIASYYSQNYAGDPGVLASPLHHSIDSVQHKDYINCWVYTFYIVRLALLEQTLLRYQPLITSRAYIYAYIQQASHKLKMLYWIKTITVEPQLGVAICLLI